MGGSFSCVFTMGLLPNDRDLTEPPEEVELWVDASDFRVKVADLVVLNADPLVDIRNTLEIDQVMRLGEWVTRTGSPTIP